MSASQIRIRALRALGCHGALPEEHSRAQPFEVDITIDTDIAPAARSDDLSATVDYSVVVTAVVGIIESRSYTLLETLTTAIAEDVSARAGVIGVTVEVRKLRPPLPAHVESVGVRLSRGPG